MFHLAIPAMVLDESVRFYKGLGCRVGRKSKDFAIIDFYGDQVVLHKSEAIDDEPRMYPRHFGKIFDMHELLILKWQSVKHEAYVFEPYFKRYEGLPEEHHTFFLKDPSNNLIEFKWYKNAEAVFNKQVKEPKA